MKYFKILVLAVFLAILCLKLFQKEAKETAQEQPANQAWEKVVDYARENLPLEGKLVIKSDGFVYLKVDDGYIHTLFPMLELAKKGFKEPPYFRSKDSPGAHISVFYANENVTPKEVGQTFHFTLKDIVIVHANQYESYAVLQVESPELEKLREKYGLSGQLRRHDYHISLAEKKQFQHR